MSIKKKIYIPVILIFMLLLVAIVINFITSDKKITNNLFNTTSIELRKAFQKEYKTSKDIGLTNAVSLSQNSYIIESLLDGSRESTQTGLNLLINEYKNNSSLNDIKIHIHDEDIKSFYRSWNPKKFGDDLSSFRKTIVNVKKHENLLLLLSWEKLA